MRRAGLTLACGALLLFAASAALGCFGAMLKVGVVAGSAKEVAAYSLGYFVAEKTGIEPEFVETADPAGAFARGEIDVALLPASIKEVEGAISRSGGNLEGLGGANIWLRKDVLDDIRFTTVEKALALLPAFYSSEAYIKAVKSGAEPKKAARKAVSDGT